MICDVSRRTLNQRPAFVLKTHLDHVIFTLHKHPDTAGLRRSGILSNEIKDTGINRWHIIDFRSRACFGYPWGDDLKKAPVIIAVV